MCNDKLRECLEDVLEWLKTGMVHDIGYDEASIVEAIEEALS